jgi:CheY-like chemotaxis protein
MTMDTPFWSRTICAAAGVNTTFLRFADGQELLDFLFGRTKEPAFDPARRYLLLLDIRMPKVDGVTALRQIKADPGLHNMPVNHPDHDRGSA